jgi:antitoxin ParD1/3/4
MSPAYAARPWSFSKLSFGARSRKAHYTTEAEVVADALRLMQIRDEVAGVKRERLKDALERGYEDVAAGRVIELDTEDEIDALFASL